MKSFWPGEWNRRRPWAEHRIDEHTKAVDLEQQRAVSEPRYAEARRRWRLPGLARIEDRNLNARNACASPEEEFTHHAGRVALKTRTHARRVAKLAVTKLARRANAFCAQAGWSGHALKLYRSTRPVLALLKWNVEIGAQLLLWRVHRRVAIDLVARAVGDAFATRR